MSSPKSHRLCESTSDRRPSLLTTRAAEASIILHTERHTGSHSLPGRILGRFFVFCEEQYYDKAMPSDLVALSYWANRPCIGFSIRIWTVKTFLGTHYTWKRRKTRCQAQLERLRGSEIWNTSPRSKEAIHQSCRLHTFSFSTTGLTCYTISDGVCSRVCPRAILVTSHSLAKCCMREIGEASYCSL